MITNEKLLKAGFIQEVINGVTSILVKGIHLFTMG